MTSFSEPAALLEHDFGSGPLASSVSVPGRVNLIGEHVDYHNLPVLPIAIQRRIRVAFRPRTDSLIRAVTSEGLGAREFEWTEKLEPSAAGDWVNYVKAAAQAIAPVWGVKHGLDAAVVSDLPPAAGLSSSSALLVAFTLALLEANGIQATFEELMNVLPEGEYFVGTRGGGMDHAAVLRAKAGHALLVNFAPVTVDDIPIPRDWAFLVAHSLTTAEKSGAVRAEYNLRRMAGTAALEKLGLASFREAVDRHQYDDLYSRATKNLDGQERGSFLHVVGEAQRVRLAVDALREGDAEKFGAQMNGSHDSLRDLLRVSNSALDKLVDCAREAGAFGARLTGAGFGGCVVIVCAARDRYRVRDEVIQRFYSKRAGFDAAKHLIDAEPSSGALLA